MLAVENYKLFHVANLYEFVLGISIIRGEVKVLFPISLLMHPSLYGQIKMLKHEIIY